MHVKKAAFMLLCYELFHNSLAFTITLNTKSSMPINDPKYRRHFGVGTLLKSSTIENDSITSVVGEADQSFRLGIELEKKGLVRDTIRAICDTFMLLQILLTCIINE